MLSPSDKNLKYKTNHNNKIMDIKMRKEYEKPLESQEKMTVLEMKMEIPDFSRFTITKM